MTATGRKRTRIVTHLHPVRKRLRHGSRWYIYAWRGGPQIAVQDGERPLITPDLIAKADSERAKLRGPSTGTMRWLIAEYRDSPQFQKHEKSTKRDYNHWLDKIEAEFGDEDIDLFQDARTRSAIDDWRNQWAHKPRTADKAVVMLSTLLNWARRERGLLAVNVAAEMSLLHTADKSDEVWEEAHARAMVNCPPQLRNALKLAWMTGLRLGDLVTLPIEAVGAKAIVLTTRKRKGRAVIPILPALRHHLDRLIGDRETGTVLVNSRKMPWTESGLGTVFQRNKPKGFDRTIHDLRGTYVTWLAIKGLTDEEIARIVGWTAKRVSEIRARYVDEARVVVSLVERLSA